jgi:hypothetical protein
MNHSQALGKIGTELIGGHIGSGGGMSGEATQQKCGHLTLVALDVGTDQRRCRHCCRPQHSKIDISRAAV